MSSTCLWYIVLFFKDLVEYIYDNLEQKYLMTGKHEHFFGYSYLYYTNYTRVY
jgi:hypothetical protein